MKLEEAPFQVHQQLGEDPFPGKQQGEVPIQKPKVEDPNRVRQEVLE
jgi:hypothetical protein